MKSSLLVCVAPIVAFSVACYVSPATSTPPGGETTKPADVGETPELVGESPALATLRKAGIALDQPLEDVMQAAEAADEADKSGKSKKVIAIMTSFTESLGVKCDYCHVANLDAKGKPIIDKKTRRPSMDFEASKPEKSIAKHMWNDWVQSFRFRDTGAPIFCDSCHQQKPTFLDRDDSEKLGAWMKKNFVERLTDAEGNDVKCSSCHGKPFNKDILDAWKAEAE